MSEGFFCPSILGVPGLSEGRLCSSLVRILPKTILVLDLVATEEEANARARNEAQSDGSEYWYRYFTREDVAKASDPRFAMGMVTHEFARAVRSGASFPAMVPLDGGGTGFAVSRNGHVLTNYHMVVGEICSAGREAGALHHEVPCRSLRAQVAARSEDGAWTWNDARDIYLVSNPPSHRAVVNVGGDRHELREDTALLRVVPSPSDFLMLSDVPPPLDTRVWMAGFPLRSARPETSLAMRNYSNANGTLRVSVGEVTATESPSYFTTDLDGSMGNSGSPTFNADGLVVGLFSRATGDGPRNALEYGYVQRVHVSAALAIRGLDLSIEVGSNG